jgi:hypothetical protein
VRAPTLLKPGVAGGAERVTNEVKRRQRARAGQKKALSVGRTATTVMMWACGEAMKIMDDDPWKSKRLLWAEWRVGERGWPTGGEGAD